MPGSCASRARTSSTTWGAPMASSSTISACRRGCLLGLELLDLILELEVEGKLHDGLGDDGVDHGIEAVAVQAVVIEGLALAGPVDNVFLPIEVAAQLLRFIGRVG